MTIFNLGSLNIDYVYAVPHFVRPGETLSSSALEIFPGGKGLNQSVALARAGARVVHCGRIGDNGGFLKEILRTSGADVTFVETDDASTGHAIIQVEESGQNCILLFAGANHSFTEDFVRRCLAQARPGDVLLLQNEINGLDTIFAVAKEKGLDIAFNPSPFRKELLALPIEQVKWWLCNEIEGSELTGETDPGKIADAMLEKFPGSNIVLTLGGDGCIFKNQALTLRQPIFPVQAVDTTAAGDTFTGFFLASVAAGRPIADALKIAARAASISVSRMGASASIPTLAEIPEA